MFSSQILSPYFVNILLALVTELITSFHDLLHSFFLPIDAENILTARFPAHNPISGIHLTYVL